MKRWFLRHHEYHLPYTQTSSSWLNQVERVFADMTENRFRRGLFKSVPALEQAIEEYLAEHNQTPSPSSGSPKPRPSSNASNGLFR